MAIIICYIQSNIFEIAVATNIIKSCEEYDYFYTYSESKYKILNHMFLWMIYLLSFVINIEIFSIGPKINFPSIHMSKNICIYATMQTYMKKLTIKEYIFFQTLNTYSKCSSDIGCKFLIGLYKMLYLNNLTFNDINYYNEAVTVFIEEHVNYGETIVRNAYRQT